MSGAAETQPSSGASLFWLVYGQIAAMLGAFSLLVFVTHFFEVGLQGVIREAFEGWVQYVRPLFGEIVRSLAALFGWHLNVSDFTKDYLGVGSTTALSMVRGVKMTPQGQQISVTAFFLIVPGVIVMWPALVPYLLLIALLDRVPHYRTRGLLTLAPLVYLGLLFAANAWLA